MSDTSIFCMMHIGHFCMSGILNMSSHVGMFLQDKAHEAHKESKSYFESAKEQAGKLLGQAGNKADEAKGEAKDKADEAHKESKGEPFFTIYPGTVMYIIRRKISFILKRLLHVQSI